MFRVWCEWDLGQDLLIFQTRERAEQWVYEAYGDPVENYWGEEGEDPFIEGLAGIQELTLVL